MGELSTRSTGPHSSDDVRTAMSAPVVTLDPDSTIRRAAAVLRRSDVGAAIVTAAGDLVDLVGMLSERDVIRAIAEGADPDTARVGASMTSPPRPIAADSPLWSATTMMLRHRIRHLPVVDGEHRIVGMLSIRDALAATDRDRIVRPRSDDLFSG
jgi:CBS domain-containing protein